MKNIMLKISGFLLIGILTFGMFGCVTEPVLWKPQSTEMVIADYITSDPDQFSEFAKLVELTGMSALLKIRGPYTLFLPTNDAMLAYYTSKNVNSVEELSDSFRKNLILNHLVPNRIGSADIGFGAIRDTNAIGDFIVTEFEGADIILNKNSKIIKRDVPTSNGVIQIIDQVLDPVTLDLYSVLSSDPGYKIFADGLNLTGLKDTLQIISFPYGLKTARTRFTLLAVPDSVYQREGINNVDELITWTGASKDNLTSLESPFYRYMEYHCLTGTFYMSGFETGIYPILSRDNNVSVRVDDDYKLNYNSKTFEYTKFSLLSSNVPAKNGAVHSIRGLLPSIDPEPSAVLFETTDFFDFKQGDYYRKYYSRWFDGENTFAKIKWKGDFLQYYYKPSQPENRNYDCLQMQGWWEVSVTFPKVMKGKYNVSMYMPPFGSTTSATVKIDGVLMPAIYGGPLAGGRGGLQVVGTGLVFDTTAEHTVTLNNIAYGSLFWDYVRFDPVK